MGMGRRNCRNANNSNSIDEYRCNGNKTINKNSTEIETVIETQTESVTNSAIKVAILKKYPGAEIINTTDSSIGYFLYNQENYSFESENNILFISKDNKTIYFIYLN